MSGMLGTMLGAGGSSACVQLARVEWQVTPEGSNGRSFESLFQGAKLGLVETPAFERN
jgi:hypothetical protein